MSTKTKFQVSELHHKFFNRVAPGNSTAGAYAFITADKLALMHDDNALAARIIDSVTDNGKPIALINSHYERWTVSALLDAVPAASMTGLHLRGAASALDRISDPEKIVLAQCEYLDRMFCQSVNSSKNATEQFSVHYPQAMLEDVETFIAFEWADKAGQQRAIDAVKNLKQKWRIIGGKMSSEVITAIAHKAAIAQAANTGISTLRAYSLGRAKALEAPANAAYIKTIKGRAAVLRDVHRVYGVNLEKAIADVLRHGLPEIGAPDIVGVYPAFLAEKEKTDRILSVADGLAGAKTAWRNAIRYSRAKVEAEPVTPYARGLVQSAREHVESRINRRARKTQAAGCLETRANLLSAWHLIQTLDLENPDLWAVDSIMMAAETCQQIAGTRHAISKFLSGMPNSAKKVYALPADLPDNLSINMRANDVMRAAREEKETRKIKNRRIDFMAALVEIANAAEKTPRKASNRLEHLMRNNYGIEDKTELSENARAAITAGLCRIDEKQEFLNGGDAPASGDWLIINGASAKTTRGAIVPTRAIRAAFAFLDSLEPGPVELSERGFKIGDYQLDRRTHTGAVIVGCHNFSAESVQFIREQLADKDAAVSA